MARSRLILGLAAVFAGLTAVLVVAALAVQPFLLLVALPFAVTTYFLWFHATGRLAKRVRRTQTASNPGTANDPESAASSRSSRFADRFRDRVADSGGTEFGNAGRTSDARSSRTRSGARGGHRARAGHRRDRTGTASPNARRYDLSRAEACRVLGVSPEADRETIKSAYRERVKRTHPDTAAGDEESFKRLNRAYERVTQD